MTQDVECAAELTLEEESCLVIDGMALAVALGKPAELITVRDLGDAFVRAVLRLGRSVQRIDETFDLEPGKRGLSITTSSEESFQMEVSNCQTTGPTLLSRPENKSFLTDLLPHHLLYNAPADKTLVVS